MKLNTRPISLFVVLSALVSAPLYAQTQSLFKGPVQLKVWKHWQQSWNVENASSEYLFELERGWEQNSSYVKLKFKNTGANLKARISCESYIPEGPWAMKKVQSENFEVVQLNTDANFTHFQFKDIPCADEALKRIVTEIKFSILAPDGSVLLDYKLLPMYVRGKDQSYWDNKILSYNAHAGTGDINVANGMNAENGNDTWGGVLVRPALNFVDRNVMMAGATIGLHRHEKNQEAYLIEAGKATMHVGMAARVEGSNRQVTRRWDLEGTSKETEEFDAQGGWIESRTMTPGQISVIVPNPQDQGTVYFHGIDADETTTFFTMGTKN